MLVSDTCSGLFFLDMLLILYFNNFQLIIYFLFIVNISSNYLEILVMVFNGIDDFLCWRIVEEEHVLNDLVCILEI